MKTCETLGRTENVHTANSYWHDLWHPLKVYPALVAKGSCIFVSTTEVQALAWSGQMFMPFSSHQCHSVWLRLGWPETCGVANKKVVRIDPKIKYQRHMPTCFGRPVQSLDLQSYVWLWECTHQVSMCAPLSEPLILILASQNSLISLSSFVFFLMYVLCPALYIVSVFKACLGVLVYLWL